MEDSVLYKKFNIKSKVNPYEVHFVNNSKSTLSKITTENDFFIVDSYINKNYADLFNDFNNVRIEIKTEEKSKEYKSISKIISKLVSKGIRKNSKIIAVGGGITQDIASFISLILYRGLNWIYFPTNLLSQCDSCIGSKLSVNFLNYKNLLGGFYPPQKIFIDTKFLETLNQIDIYSGLGEMLHYFLVSENLKDYKFFKKKIQLFVSGQTKIEELIFRSLKIKRKMIEFDEFDEGPRNIFNYGHTFGHALESVTKYTVPHGISVAYGIDLANFISVDLGFIDMSTRNEIRELCQIIFRKKALPKIKLEDYEIALKRDKKNIGQNLGLILTRGVGNMFKHYIQYSEIKQRISDFFENKLYKNSL